MCGLGTILLEAAKEWPVSSKVLMGRILTRWHCSSIVSVYFKNVTCNLSVCSCWKIGARFIYKKLAGFFGVLLGKF